jgi:hypothetical protein
MTTVAILPEENGTTEVAFRAVAGPLQSVGRTPGEALDRLTAQLGDAADSGTLVVIQPRRPDSYFTAEQQGRLAALMQRWRSARAAGTTLTAAEQAELEGLVQAELQAATARAAALVRQLAP